MTIDLDAYLRRIAFDGETPAPDLRTLRRLVACHAAVIPFENIDVLAGRVPALDLASLQQKCIQQRRGGYCFEQNTLFMAVLQQLGFSVQGLEARVRAGVPAEVETPRTHMALRVRIESREWLADVGFGALAPMAPLQLDAGAAEQSAAGGHYRLLDAPDGERLLQALAHEGWSDCYRIGPARPQAIDYEMGNWWVATHPKAMLRHNLLLARAVDGGRMTLFNRSLSVRRPQTQAPVVRDLAGRDEIAEVLAKDFGLDVPASDFEAVMRVLDAQR